MDFTDALPEDELQLARLTASKLAQVMHGLMSVGTGALELDHPENFLAGRERTPLGFLEVLRCIGVRPGHADKIAALRERVDELSRLATDFHRHFMELAGWRSTSSQDVWPAVERFGDSYIRFCRQLADFCSLLGMLPASLAQAEQDRRNLEAVFEALAVH